MAFSFMKFLFETPWYAGVPISESDVQGYSEPKEYNPHSYPLASPVGCGAIPELFGFVRNGYGKTTHRSFAINNPFSQKYFPWWANEAPSTATWLALATYPANLYFIPGVDDGHVCTFTPGLTTADTFINDKAGVYYPDVEPAVGVLIYTKPNLNGYGTAVTYNVTISVDGSVVATFAIDTFSEVDYKYVDLPAPYDDTRRSIKISINGDSTHPHKAGIIRIRRSGYYVQKLAALPTGYVKIQEPYIGLVSSEFRPSIGRELAMEEWATFDGGGTLPAVDMRGGRQVSADSIYGGYNGKFDGNQPYINACSTPIIQSDGDFKRLIRSDSYYGCTPRSDKATEHDYDTGRQYTNAAIEIWCSNNKFRTYFFKNPGGASPAFDPSTTELKVWITTVTKREHPYLQASFFNPALIQVANTTALAMTFNWTYGSTDVVVTTTIPGAASPVGGRLVLLATKLLTGTGTPTPAFWNGEIYDGSDPTFSAPPPYDTPIVSYDSAIPQSAREVVLGGVHPEQLESLHPNYVSKVGASPASVLTFSSAEMWPGSKAFSKGLLGTGAPVVFPSTSGTLDYDNLTRRLLLRWKGCGTNYYRLEEQISVNGSVTTPWQGTTYAVTTINDGLVGGPLIPRNGILEVMESRVPTHSPNSNDVTSYEYRIVAITPSAKTSIAALATPYTLPHRTANSIAIPRAATFAAPFAGVFEFSVGTTSSDYFRFRACSAPIANVCGYDFSRFPEGNWCTTVLRSITDSPTCRAIVTAYPATVQDLNPCFALHEDPDNTLFVGTPWEGKGGMLAIAYMHASAAASPYPVPSGLSWTFATVSPGTAVANSAGGYFMRDDPAIPANVVGWTVQTTGFHYPMKWRRTMAAGETIQFQIGLRTDLDLYRGPGSARHYWINAPSSGDTVTIQADLVPP
jgi:hypothetical protein